MAEQLKPILHPQEAAALTPEWAARVKYALSLPGCSARGVGLAIICSTRYGRQEGPLLLPNGGETFATPADLNAALDLLNISHP
jgi:hypothetical protein